MRVLAIDNKLMSFPSKMAIVDSDARVVFSCKTHAGILGPSWSIVRGATEVASLHQGLSFTHAWKVRSELGDFNVHRKITWLTRVLEVVGGPFDRAVLSGSLLDREFELMFRGAIVARAHAGLMSLRDHHVIEILSDAKGIELITAIAMVCLHAEHIEEHAI